MTARILASTSFDIINNARDFTILAEDQVQILVLAAAQHVCAENGDVETARKLVEILSRTRTSRGEDIKAIVEMF